METQTNITFTWDNANFNGFIEKVYENSYLVHVENPNEELAEKYNSRIVISKKNCIEKID